MLRINDDLIIKYEKLVYSIIYKYMNNSNKDDLFQAGMIGVLKASEKYDSSLNIKFTSFAYKYILGEVLQTIREDRNIRVSRDLIKDYKKIVIAREHIYKEYGRPISDRELSKLLKISEERISEAISYNEREVSLSKVISDDDKICLEDVLYNNDIDSDKYIDLKNALQCLSNQEQKLIYDRYFNNKTQTEIAKEKNTSQVKVYRYERKILDKLKDKML